MTVTVKTRGFAAMEGKLLALGNPRLATRIAKEALEEEAEPIRALAEKLAPDDPKTAGNLKQSIKFKTGRRRDTVTTRIGIDTTQDPPTDKPRKSGQGTYRDPGVPGNAVIQEFGTTDMAPNPFMRPAWDARKSGLIERIGAALARRYDAAAKKLR